MRSIVVTGGLGPGRDVIERFVAGVDLVCACDSGYELALELNLEPDVVVGDMDSISSHTLLENVPQDRLETYPEAKDETDTEIGIRTAKEHGASEIVLIGGGGGRLDHLFGILSIFHRDPQLVTWLTEGEVITQITGRLECRGMAGRLVSFFPLAGEPCSMSTSGLKWPLDELRWAVGDVGISNEVSEDRLVIQMRTGRLIMVHPHGG